MKCRSRAVFVVDTGQDSPDVIPFTTVLQDFDRREITDSG